MARQEERVVVFGEVLFDRFPDGAEVLGGAPFNVAWNLRGLGLRPLFVSRVGRDELARRVIHAMDAWRLDRAGLQIDETRPTGTVEVALVDGEPTFEIVADRAYDQIDEDLIDTDGATGMLYHGSLVCRSERSRSALERLIHRSRCPVFYDVNLRDPWWDPATVGSLLGTATEVKMNDEELRRLAPEADGLELRAAALMRRHGFERLHVTRGAHGAISFGARNDPIEVRPESAVPVVDTVGAGDAFSAVLILGRVLDWAPETTLARARDFAAAVVGLRGATTLRRGFYDEFREKWEKR